MFQAIKHGAKVGMKIFKANRPAILTGIGIVGYLACIPLTAAGVRKMEKMKQEVDMEKATKKEKAKMAAKCYWKVAGCAAGATAAVIFGHIDEANRLSAMGAMFMASQQELAANKETLRQVLTEKKAKEVEAAINEKKVRQIVENDQGEIIVTNAEGVHFIDKWSGTKFVSSFPEVKGAFADFREKCMLGEMSSVNDLRYLLGLDEIGAGDVMFWIYEDLASPGTADQKLIPVWGDPVEVNGATYIPFEYSIEPSFYKYD